MRTYVFLGPTLPVEEARALLPDAVYLPPVTQGEVVALLPSRPKRIAIIDGSFEWIPAVWHKEILLALEQGVEVYGAASMGALRAAELCAFGMQGVGAIFEGYRDGVILGDDEYDPENEGAFYDDLATRLGFSDELAAEIWNNQLATWGWT